MRNVGSYTTAARRAGVEPPTFTMNDEFCTHEGCSSTFGKRGDDAGWLDEERKVPCPSCRYMCAAAIPGGVMFDVSGLGEATKHERLKIIASFMDSVMLPDDAARFAGKLRDPADPLDIETAMRIMGDLMKEYTGNPTVSPSPSADGQSAGGASSMGIASASESMP